MHAAKISAIQKKPNYKCIFSFISGKITTFAAKLKIIGILQRIIK